MRGGRAYLIIVLALAALTLRHDAGATPALTTRVSVPNGPDQAILGTQGDGNSQVPSFSADGRFVAFYSDATNLVPGDTNTCPPFTTPGQCRDVFVHDRQSGATERVSVDSAGAQSNHESLGPRISGDGRFVAFFSRATNLVTGDTNGYRDVFVHDRLTGATTRVSVASDGAQGEGDSTVRGISGNGRFIVFFSAAQLVPQDTNTSYDVYLHDRDTAATSLVSRSADGTAVGGNEPAISVDGRFIAFYSFASNLVPGDTNAKDDVFVHDRLTGTTERVSVTSSEEQANAGSGRPELSADGRFVAFDSEATNLMTGDTNDCTPPPPSQFRSCSDVFVRDRENGTTIPISIGNTGTVGNHNSLAPAISADGRYVAYSSFASNLVTSDTNNNSDVFVRDRLSGITARVSTGVGGAEADHGVSCPQIDPTGRYAASCSNATNLVADDTNAKNDVFVHDLGDTDADGETDPFDACPSDPDCDDDAFGDGAERTIGTNPLAACGTDAWPPDINNDTLVDIIGDISVVASSFGQSVPPAPARYDIAPDPPDDLIDVISDLSRMAGLFGTSCAP
jgi:Tol biopolymer transport system component